LTRRGEDRRAGLLGGQVGLPEDLQAIYRMFGIDLAKGNGDGTWRLPLPARFVIDRGGIVRGVDADPDYTRRPEPSATIEALRTPLPPGGFTNIYHRERRGPPGCGMLARVDAHHRAPDRRR